MPDLILEAAIFLCLVFFLIGGQHSIHFLEKPIYKIISLVFFALCVWLTLSFTVQRVPARVEYAKPTNVTLPNGGLVQIIKFRDTSIVNVNQKLGYIVPENYVVKRTVYSMGPYFLVFDTDIEDRFEIVKVLKK